MELEEYTPTCVYHAYREPLYGSRGLYGSHGLAGHTASHAFTLTINSWTRNNDPDSEPIFRINITVSFRLRDRTRVREGKRG